MGAVYTQLSLRERRRIEDWWHAKVPVREMARVLKRHKSTILREIKRNFWADDLVPKKYAGYFAMAAHQRTLHRRPTQRKLIRHPVSALNWPFLVPGPQPDTIKRSFDSTRRIFVTRTKPYP
ncbi:helix-turn-helix domain-containing protein [uncultured Tateyamaria sp.]|uniref:helix-turn-helix domain-containing protein n=1 Tax=uncultured Tateyamaria sp. TaxID=455651 RepID=UPI0034521E40